MRINILELFPITYIVISQIMDLLYKRGRYIRLYRSWEQILYLLTIALIFLKIKIRSIPLRICGIRMKNPDVWLS